MSTMQKVIEVLESEVVFGAVVNEITADHHLVDDLGLDSLDTVELAMALEEEFGIDIDDEEIEGWGRVRDVAEMVDRKLAVAR